MKQVIYAGSFDPWTFGHQFVLNTALEVFDRVHIVSATNPSKKSLLKPAIRARVIAHAIDPLNDWWSFAPPFLLDNRVVVTSHDGLIADYARENGISYLVRGLRSTSDFEAEFNLYFANQAIESNLQTWAIMCPPNLLHCSSTYVKTVVGKKHVKFVGTPFISQSLMLNWSRFLGQIFDLIEICSKFRFEAGPFNLNAKDLSDCLQILFTNLYLKFPSVSEASTSILEKAVDKFINSKGHELKKQIFDYKKYPEREVNELWAILCYGLDKDMSSFYEERLSVSYILSLTENLGKTKVKLFYEEDVSYHFNRLKKELAYG